MQKADEAVITGRLSRAPNDNIQRLVREAINLMGEQGIIASKVLARVQNHTVPVRLSNPFHHRFPLLLGTYFPSSPCLTPDTEINDTFDAQSPP